MDVLMIRLGGLGDLLVAAPSMAYLRRTMPGAGFGLVCRGEYGELMIDAGLADFIVAAEGRMASRLFSGAPDAADGDAYAHARAVGWLQRPAPPELEAGMKARGSEATFFAAEALPGEGSLARRFFEATRAAFPPAAGCEPGFDECALLRSARGAITSARALLCPGLPASGDFAVIHPGSGGRPKLWPLERFLAIAGRAANEGLPGVLVTGDTEEASGLAADIARARLPREWFWARRPPLLALAGLLAEGPLYLGNDSGVTHLAAACGARVTALFPDAHRPEWEPYGRTVLLSAPVLEALDVESVWSSFRNA